MEKVLRKWSTDFSHLLFMGKNSKTFIRDINMLHELSRVLGVVKIICSKLILKTLEQGVKYVQS